jgi:phosphate transport system substrate-binding protein
VAAAVAELTYTCVDGNVTLSSPTLMSDVVASWSDSLSYACVDDTTTSVVEPTMTLTVADGTQASVDAEISDYPAACAPVQTVPLAVEAGVLVYMESDLSSFSVSPKNLAGIMNGTITNWKELGGPDQAIVPVSRDQQAGGTVDYIVKEVLGGASFSPSVVPARDTTASIRTVGTTPGGIGYATAAEVIGQQMVRPIALGKHADQLVAPYSDNAQSVNRQGFEDGTYPLTRRLFMILRRDGQRDEQAGVAYTNMLLSDDGQRLIEKAGFVPLRPQ